jgi:multiple sugar transport system ATP-binding protein
MDMRSELKRLHRDTHATAIYVTHDQLEALTMSTHVAVMCAGKLQQLASPDEVYRYPANLFVADFIGSPKVNLLEGHATPAPGGTRVDVGQFVLEPLPVWAEGPVVAAVRPEDVQLSAEPVAGGVEFSVYSVLPAGSEAIVNVRRGETMLTVKVGRATRLEMDQSVWLTFDPRSINLYDKASQLLIAA